jgi:hypothetical protein
MIKEIQQQSNDQFKDLLKQQNEVMLAMIAKKDDKPSKDSNFGGEIKPTTFKSEDGKYHEWIVKLLAYLRSKASGCEVWMKWAMESECIVDSGKIMTKFIDDSSKVEEFSKKLQLMLVNICEGESFTICTSVTSGEGLASLRLLRRRFDPKTPGTKRALLKSLVNMNPCKKVNELEAAVQRMEEMIKKFNDMSGTELPEDLVVCFLIELCHKELREHLELSSKEMGKQQVREEIMSYVEIKRSAVNEQFVSMEVDYVNHEHEGHRDHERYNDWWNVDEGTFGWYGGCEVQDTEINYFNQFKGGKGKSKGGHFDKGYGKGKNGKSGNFGSNFGSWKGGKGGKDDKGGKDSGKGEKGKGFQGDCYFCGKYGHSQRNCTAKDEYMQWQRGKGGNQGVNSMEEDNPKVNTKECGSLERTSNNTFWLASLEKAEAQTKNRFQCFERNEEQAGSPPGLEKHQFPKMPRFVKPKWNKKRREDKELSALVEYIENEGNCHPTVCGDNCSARPPR